MLWLLESNARQILEQAYKCDISRYEALSSANSRILTISGDTAEIVIKGIITQSPDPFAAFFGGGNTTYSDIIAALAEANADPSVTSITLAIDSPGGQFDGLFDTLAAIQSVGKPVKAVISNVAASAAYAIASQADEVIATNRAARIGSVGVVVTIGVNDNEVTITSTDAPKKRPDVTTQEGVEMVREELDALHAIFVEAIADGRGTTVERINADFGQGATLLAEDALKRGMIDAVAGAPLRVVENAETTTARSGGNKPETGTMDLKELKAQHPDVYMAAVQEGVDQERDRVTAHLTMGEASGDTKTAFSAIKDGSGMTATLQATYMTAGLNRRDVEARQSDDVSAAAGDSANLSESQGDAGDTVASLVEARLGVGV